MNEEPQTNGPGPMIHIGLFLLRLVAGVTLIVNYSWAMVYTGWKHFWDKEEWSMIAGAADLGLPQPVVWAVVTSIVLFFGSVFLIAGLLGRITSGLLLFSAMGILYAALSRDLVDYAQICILYAGIFLSLFAMGHGAISLDRVFAMRPKKRRPDGLQDLT